MKLRNLIIWICIIGVLCIFLSSGKIYPLATTSTSIEPFAIYKESMLNSKEYKVQKYNNPQEAAEILAQLTKNTKMIVDYLKDKHYEDERVVRLDKRLKDLNIEEAIHEEGASSYTINKGELMALCLRHKDKAKNFHDIQTLMFVLIHELAHVMSVSEGHNAEFMDNFRFILKEATNSGVYQPVDYSNSPMTYCGVKVTHNPYY